MTRRALILAFAAACVFLVLFFHEGPSGNGMSRLLTVFGLVEDHTYQADRWQKLTFDKSWVNGHIYSDKAPLSSYVVLPFYWLWRQYDGGQPQAPADLAAANHIAELVAAATPFAIFVVLIWIRLSRSTAFSAREAVWFALVGGFGTSVLNYGNSYFGHVLAGTLFLGSYILSVERGRRYAWAGLLGGCAVSTEYPLAIGVAFILAYLAVEKTDRARRLLAYCAGALPAAAVFFFHNQMVTGHLFHVPYAHVVDNWKPMQTAFGMRAPGIWAMWNLSFTPYRGVFFYGPLLLLAFPLLFFRFDGPSRRRLLVIALCLVYFVFNSAYYRWDGGWCTGPRHLTPIIMLCVYEGAAALAGAGRACAGPSSRSALSAWRSTRRSPPPTRCRRRISPIHCSRRSSPICSRTA